MNVFCHTVLGSPGSPSPGAPAPPAPPGHHRASSAPPAPQPPPMALAPPTSSPQTAMPPPAPPAPPCPPWLGASSQPPAPPMVAAVAAPPPPPPPPAPNMSRSCSSDGQEQTSSLAAQLQSAKLRRSNKVRMFLLNLSQSAVLMKNIHSFVVYKNGMCKVHYQSYFYFVFHWNFKMAGRFQIQPDSVRSSLFVHHRHWY